MKIYGIATKERECFGHGDYGDVLRINRTGEYMGPTEWPPFFDDPSKAREWADGNGLTSALVVELKLI